MYLISYKHHEVQIEVLAEYKSLFSLLTILNKAKLYFTIANNEGKVTPSQLGFGYFKYWIPETRKDKKMEVKYLNFDQQESITNEQIEQIAFMDIEEGKPAVILTLDDGQKILVTTSEYTSIYKYKG